MCFVRALGFMALALLFPLAAHAEGPSPASPPAEASAAPPDSSSTPAPAPTRPATPILAAASGPRAPFGFVGSIAIGPNLFAGLSEPLWASGLAGGFGFRFDLGSGLSIPVRADARYIFDTRSGAQKFELAPNAGVRLASGKHWVSLAGGLCYWPAYFQEPFLQEFGGHIALRYGLSPLTIAASVDVVGRVVVQRLEIGLGM